MERFGRLRVPRHELPPSGVDRRLIDRLLRGRPQRVLVAQLVDPAQVAALTDQLIDRESAVLAHDANLATTGDYSGSDSGSLIRKRGYGERVVGSSDDPLTFGTWSPSCWLASLPSFALILMSLTVIVLDLAPILSPVAVILVR